MAEPGNRSAKRTLSPGGWSSADEAPSAQPDDPPGTGFPIVGVGASAGGLAAFEGFFSGMPAETDPDMAFVLVQHLAPDHKSILTDLVQRYTRMQAVEVEDGIEVLPNHTHIIPPNQRERAIGMVLSGTGSDGTQGVRATHPHIRSLLMSALDA